MGQAPGAHVVLQTFLLGGPGFFWVPIDGTPATFEPFVVENKSALVVTDVDIIMDAGIRNRRKSFTIGFLARNISDPRPGQPFVLTVRGTFDDRGKVGQNIAMTTGFVVFHGVRIDLSLSLPVILPPRSDLQGHITLRGYLIAVDATPPGEVE